VTAVALRDKCPLPPRALFAVAVWEWGWVAHLVDVIVFMVLLIFIAFLKKKCNKN
jgi:hypothetical protein